MTPSTLNVSKANSIDLSKPDADAAALAEKLQAAHTQMTFTRAMFFIGKWIIRPIFWWPIKYLYKLTFQIMLFSTPSPKAVDQNRLQQQRDDANRWRQNNLR